MKATSGFPKAALRGGWNSNPRTGFGQLPALQTSAIDHSAASENVARRALHDRLPAKQIFNPVG